MSEPILEAAAQEIADATNRSPFLYELGGDTPGRFSTTSWPHRSTSSTSLSGSLRGRSWTAPPSCALAIRSPRPRAAGASAPSGGAGQSRACAGGSACTPGHCCGERKPIWSPRSARHGAWTGSTSFPPLAPGSASRRRWPPSATGAPAATSRPEKWMLIMADPTIILVYGAFADARRAGAGSTPSWQATGSRSRPRRTRCAALP
jgi:hypothetical protein